MSVPKYKPEYCAMLIEHMKKGHSYESFGSVVGCGRSTIYGWEEGHKDWKAAKKEAFERAMYFFEQRLIAKVSGQDIKGVDTKKIDTACLIFALKTRFYQTYSEPKEEKAEQKPIEIKLNYSQSNKEDEGQDD